MKRRIKRRLSCFFWRLPNRRLWTRIFPVILVTVAVPVTLLGFLWLHTSERAMCNTVMTEHKEIAVIASREIALSVQRAEDILKSTSVMLGAVYPSPWRQETVLVELVLNQPIFLRVVSVNIKGEPWAGSEMGKPLPEPYPQEILSTALREGAFVSEMKMQDDRTPYVIMVTPIKKVGRAVGYLIGDVNLRGVWDVVDRIQVGETGRAFLVSRAGQLIAHPDKKRVIKKEDVSGERDVRLALAGEAGAARMKDASGKEVITAYTPVPGTGWGFVLRQDRDEAFRFSGIMKAQFLLIIGIGELLVLLASIVIAQFLTRPLKALGSKIRAVADGNLDQNLVVGRRDEMGELVRSFNRMTARLREAREKTRLSAVGEAAAWISHELKNSLMLLKFFVYSFPKEHADEAFIDRFDRLVPSEVSRWERLLNEFSGLSSRDALKRERVNVHNLLAETLEMLSKKLKEHDIAVRHLRPQPGLFAMADQERLKQVFINIIMNAIDAMPQGGSLTIATQGVSGTTAHQPKVIEVRVKDTGRDISADALDKVFDPFYTTQRGHTGLGLSICRRIIEQHGGSIRVESGGGGGGGTTFIIEIPVEAPAVLGR